MTASFAPVVLVTGCSSGIGRATALRLARAGMRVYATARRVETLAELAAAGCRTMALDVTDEASRAAAVAQIEGEHGAIDVLVNNAGYSQSGAVEAVPLDRMRAQFETNVFGALRLIQLVLPGMRRKGRGRIINLSSMGGLIVLPGGGLYHASKHAIEAASHALRFEVRPFGVDVVVIRPGLIRTAFGEVAAGSMDVPDVGGVYAAFHTAVSTATRESYHQGPLSKLASEPDAVARAIERAIVATRPRPAYVVSPSAHVFLWLWKVLPARAWDRVMRSAYPALERPTSR